MKKALILYWHGLGDVIMLTPHLRHLYKKGYRVDLMCRAEVRKSHLLDHCPYVDRLIEVMNPWRSKMGFIPQAAMNITRFNNLCGGYDWVGMSSHNVKEYEGYHKIDMTSAELKLEIKDKKLEVFISKEAEQQALDYGDEEFIFCHTEVKNHPYNSWDATQWMAENLPTLKIVDRISPIFDDINAEFALARLAKHRVLSDSVFAHACNAMGVVVDVINYGRFDRKVWPLDQSKVLHIREEGKWIK